jgi:chromosome segregation ATPase
MIVSIAYFGLGFFAATLCGLVVIPLLHARTTRLTTHALQAPFPVSMAEIKTDKDQLRAEITMSLRGLERKVKQLRIGARARLTEIGTKNSTIDRLKAELAEKAVALAAVEARDRALRQRLNATEEELSSSESALRDAKRALTDKELQLAWITTHFKEPSALANGLQFRRAIGRLNKNAATSTTEIHLKTLQTAPPTAPAEPPQHD